MFGVDALRFGPLGRYSNIASLDNYQILRKVTCARRPKVPSRTLMWRLSPMTSDSPSAAQSVRARTRALSARSGRLVTSPPETSRKGMPIGHCYICSLSIPNKLPTAAAILA